MGEMRIIGSKPGITAAEEVEKEERLLWNRDNPEEVKKAQEIFMKYLLEGWFAFSEEDGKKTQLFTFDKNLKRIVLAPIMFGG